MAQEALKARLLKATSTVDSAGIRYAVIGGNAVAEHVARIDPAAVRTTADVDLLVSESGLDSAKIPMEKAGFKYRKAEGVHLFMDTDSVRSAVHVIVAGRKVRSDYVEPAPELDEIERSSEGFAVIPLHQLVVMKLTSFRDKDRTHLRDMIDVGLLPADHLHALHPVLRDRLQMLIENPE